MEKQKNLIIILGFLILGFLARLLPHPANFVPIGAIAVFAGAKLKGQWSFILPLAIILFSDFLIGFYQLEVMASVYLSFLLYIIFGQILARKTLLKNLIGASLLGSICFFFITNGAVWAYSGMYSLNLSGLGQSYLMALPFFRNTLISDLFYTGILFGLYEIIAVRRFSKLTSLTKKI